MKLAPPVTSTGLSFQNDKPGSSKTYSPKVDSMLVLGSRESGPRLLMQKPLDGIHFELPSKLLLPFGYPDNVKIAT